MMKYTAQRRCGSTCSVGVLVLRGEAAGHARQGHSEERLQDMLGRGSRKRDGRI